MKKQKTAKMNGVDFHNTVSEVIAKALYEAVKDGVLIITVANGEALIYRTGFDHNHLWGYFNTEITKAKKELGID